MMNYSIAIDTREKIPWCLNHELYDIYKKKLDTGDYSIIGYEEVITIDRKKSVDEIATNLTRDYPRFRKELIRMTSFKEAYFICEFSLDDLLKYPNSINTRIRISGKSLFKQIETIQEKYRVKFIFASDRFEAQKIALDIFQNFIDKYGLPNVETNS